VPAKAHLWKKSAVTGGVLSTCARAALTTALQVWSIPSSQVSISTSWSFVGRGILSGRRRRLQIRLVVPELDFPKPQLVLKKETLYIVVSPTEIQQQLIEAAQSVDKIFFSFSIFFSFLLALVSTPPILVSSLARDLDLSPQVCSEKSMTYVLSYTISFEMELLGILT
jgi:hypothetical protein